MRYCGKSILMMSRRAIVINHVFASKYYVWVLWRNKKGTRKIRERKERKKKRFKKASGNSGATTE